MSSVLIIEDHAVIREPIAMALQTRGYEVRLAASGVAALHICQDTLPDLILLDLIMPDMDGIAFLRNLRRIEGAAKLPVIVLTSVLEKPILAEVMQLGISAILLKSRFSLHRLLDLVFQKLAAPAMSAPQAPCPMPAPAPAAARERTRTIPACRPEPATRVHANPAAVSAPPRHDGAGNLAAMTPLMTRSKLLELIDQCGELQGFSPAIGEVLALTASAQCSMDDVAGAISRDHAIALKILRLANSAVYSRGEPVDGVHKAVRRIGLKQIRQTVLNLAVVERFSNGIDGFIDGGQFWEHSIATGMIAAELMRARDEKEVEAAFTIGLLHDVGRMVLATQLGETYRAVVQAARDRELPLEDVERRLLGATHADVMDRVFRVWKFSKHLIEPIVMHHAAPADLRRAVSGAFEQAATVMLADRLAHAMLLGSSGNDVIAPTEELCDLLRVHGAVIDAIMQTAPAEIDKVKLSFLARSGAAAWPQLCDVQRRALDVPLRPLYLSAAPPLDAYRIVVDRLAEPPGGGPANLGIIHWRQPRERGPLTQRFLAEEKCRGGTLPLLIIAPQNAAEPEASLISARPWASVMSPTALPRLIKAMRELLQGSAARAAA